MSLLFTPYDLRGTTVRNRVWVAPMCQYSAVDGMPDDWHLVHLGSFARGGAGLVISEATAVSPEGRISPEDTGIWADAQADAWRRITGFVHDRGALAGVQLAHAGRKASTFAPFRGRGSVAPADGGWETVAPSAVAHPDLAPPRALTLDEVGGVVADFAAAARRAVGAGFDVLEVHAAHGYLLHQFLSPLSNHRTDGYGGSFEGRTRLLLEVVTAIRAAVPGTVPVLVRISATDWLEGGWSLDDSVRLAPLLRDAGVDLVDVSTGGLLPARIPVEPGYQVPLAARIRRETGMPTAAVGLITEPKQAEEVLAEGSADAVLLARALLREPHWPLRAAHELGEAVDSSPVGWPRQYRLAARG